jgi:hypothetical protein
VIQQLDEGLFCLWLHRRVRLSDISPGLIDRARSRFDLVKGADLLEPEARFLQAMVGKWSKEVMTIAGKLDEDFKFPRVSNPYGPTKARSGSPFYAVREERDLVQNILSPSSGSGIVVLTGLPGIGVSTLLADLSERLPMAQTSLTQVVEETDIEGSLFSLLTRAIAQRMNQNPPAILSADNRRWAFQRYIFDAVDFLGGQLTIVIDDFELVTSKPHITAPITTTIKFLADLSSGGVGGLSLILAGHLVSHEIGGIVAPYVIPLSLFDYEETEVMFGTPVVDRTFFFPVKTVERIQEQTGGHPYLIRFLRDELVSRYNRLSSREPVFWIDDVDEIIQSPQFQVHVERKVYRAMMRFIPRIGGGADALLNEIAQNPNARTDDDLALFVNMFADGQVRETLAELAALHFIMRGEPRYGQETWRLTIPLFQDYLRRR